jgi:hypothetical protein
VTIERSARDVVGSTATEIEETGGPTSPSTPLSIRLRAAAIPLAGSLASSSLRISIGWPLTPPLEFVRSTREVSALSWLVPRPASGPDNGPM